MSDCFEIIDHKYWKVSDDRKTITRTKGTPSASVYGKCIIPSDKGGIYDWKFKILKENTNMRFGISSQWDTDSRLGYISSSNYCAEHSGGKWSKMMNRSYDGFSFGNGDEVQMTLNLDNKKLLFSINGNSIGAAYKNIDVGPGIKYRMAIHFRDTDTKAQLIEFQSPLQNNDDEKDDSIAKRYRNNQQMKH